MIALKEEYPLLSIELSVDTNAPLIDLLRDGRLEFSALLTTRGFCNCAAARCARSSSRNSAATTPPSLVETSSFMTTTDLIAHSRMIAVIPQSVANLHF